MKWDDLYDGSRAAAEDAVAGLLGEDARESEAPAGAEDAVRRVASRLQDGDYVASRLEERRRYDGARAYGRLLRGERRRRLRRLGVWTGVAACVAAAVGAFWLLRGGGQELPPAVVEAETELLPGRMRAVLVKGDGEQVALGEPGRRELVEEGVRMAADSSGLVYVADGARGEGEAVMNTLLVPRGGMYSLELEDGTRVWLNADSRLEYPAVFPSGRREVSLSGEAYFAVARDTSAPFTVRTARGDVRVLGTEFNVKCYADEGVMEATLVEGQVGLSEEGAGSVVLEPGEQAVVGEGVQGIAVREVNVQHYIGWRENRLSFQGETLEEIMQVLARWYDIEVVFEDARLRGLEFSGNLDKYTDIDSFFRLFELGAEVRFERAGRTVYVRAKRQ